MTNRLSSLRPGVFTEYTVSPRAGSGQGKQVAALVIRRQEGPYEPVYLTSAVELNNLFPGQGNLLLREAASLLLQGRPGGIWCRPVKNSAVEEDYQTALADLAGLEQLNLVCWDGQGPDLACVLRDWVVRRSEKGKECLGVMAAREPVEAKIVAREANSERLLVCCGAGVYAQGSTPCLMAAALTGLLLGMTSPMENLGGVALPEGVGLESRLEEEQVEALLTAGAIPFETVAGRVECIRAVTSRTMTDGGPDATYRSVNTTLILDHVLSGLRNALKQRLRTGRGGYQTRESILSQVLVELAAYQEQGLLEQYDPPTAYAAPEDPGLCVVELAFTVAQTVGQILVSAQVRV